MGFDFVVGCVVVFVCVLVGIVGVWVVYCFLFVGGCWVFIVIVVVVGIVVRGVVVD